LKLQKPYLSTSGNSPYPFTERKIVAGQLGLYTRDDHAIKHEFSGEAQEYLKHPQHNWNGFASALKPA